MKCHFIVIKGVITFEQFKLQIVTNLASVSLSNKKVNFYTYPKLIFLEQNATENASKSISEPLDFKIFWRGGGGGELPQSPQRLAASALQTCLVFMKSCYGPVQWPIPDSYQLYSLSWTQSIVFFFRNKTIMIPCWRIFELHFNVLG